MESRGAGKGTATPEMSREVASTKLGKVGDKLVKASLLLEETKAAVPEAANLAEEVRDVLIRVRAASVEMSGLPTSGS